MGVIDPSETFATVRFAVAEFGASACDFNSPPQSPPASKSCRTTLDGGAIAGLNARGQGAVLSQRQRQFTSGQQQARCSSDHVAVVLQYNEWLLGTCVEGGLVCWSGTAALEDRRAQSSFKTPPVVLCSSLRMPMFAEDGDAKLGVWASGR
jgi:hypothetical protein